MGWLTRRDTPRRIFEDGVRWVEAIEGSRADARQFVYWATSSPAHMEAFVQAWTIWHDLRALPREQREPVPRTTPNQ